MVLTFRSDSLDVALESKRVATPTRSCFARGLSIKGLALSVLHFFSGKVVFPILVPKEEWNFVNRTSKTLTMPMKTSSATEYMSEVQEQIRRRAYELYEQRGREDGRELDDWLQAESELMQAKEKTTAA
jgi:hypothetical protein